MLPRSTFVRFSILLHVIALILLVAMPHAWPFIVGGIVANHLALLWGSLWPSSRLVGRNVRRLREEEHGGNAVALTFDDGPDPEVTPEVLRILERYGARATFFCVGRRAEAHPELVGRISAAGHAVENHSYRHSNLFSFFVFGAMAREIDRAQEVLGAITGTRPRFFRAPAGLRNPWLDGALAARGLELVSWTRRGLDTLVSDPARVVARLTDGLAAGDVLLLHDGGPIRAGGRRPVVLDALPRLLEALDRNNLRSIALPRRPSSAAPER